MKFTKYLFLFSCAFSLLLGKIAAQTISLNGVDADKKFKGAELVRYSVSDKLPVYVKFRNGKEPVKGRVDKKFCSDYCRNAYNNNVNKDSKNLIRNINNRLRKNYKILSDLNVSGKTKVSRTKLYDKGFDFQFFTSIYKTKTGNIYFYIYDEGYLALENETFLLIRKER